MEEMQRRKSYHERKERKLAGQQTRILDRDESSGRRVR